MGQVYNLLALANHQQIQGKETGILHANKQHRCLPLHMPKGQTSNMLHALVVSKENGVQTFKETTWVFSPMKPHTSLTKALRGLAACHLTCMSTATARDPPLVQQHSPWSQQPPFPALCYLLLLFPRLAWETHMLLSQLAQPCCLTSRPAARHFQAPRHCQKFQCYLLELV